MFVKDPIHSQTMKELCIISSLSIFFVVKYLLCDEMRGMHNKHEIDKVLKLKSQTANIQMDNGQVIHDKQTCDHNSSSN